MRYLPGVKLLVSEGIIDPEVLQPLANLAVKKWREKEGAWEASGCLVSSGRLVESSRSRGRTRTVG